MKDCEVSSTTTSFETGCGMVTLFHSMARLGAGEAKIILTEEFFYVSVVQFFKFETDTSGVIICVRT